MMEPLQDPAAIAAADLLSRYGFDVGAFSTTQLVGYWLRSYPAQWVRAAVVEALYQGRYKSVSVGQILAIWKRRGQPLYHYGFEFERMVCGTLARIPTQELGAEPETPASAEPEVRVRSPNDSPPTDSPLESSAELVEPVAPEPIAPAQVEEPQMLDLEAYLEHSPLAHAGSFEDFEFLTHQDWGAQNEGVKHPIDQFVPDSEISLFYEKLRAVALDQRN